MKAQIHNHLFSFLTKYSIFNNYGFIDGVVRICAKKIIPEVPSPDTLEYYLFNNKELYQKDQYHFVTEIIDDLKLKHSEVELKKLISYSIYGLYSKVKSFLLDNHIISKLEIIGIPFQEIEALMLEDNRAILNIKHIEKIEDQFLLLRQKKSKIGTSLHLTYRTRTTLHYIKRIKQLIKLYDSPYAQSTWEQLVETYYQNQKTSKSLSKYVARHIDLVFLQIVEYTSSKGEKYVADSRQEHLKFFKKSMKAGFIIAIFALLKIGLDYFTFNQFSSAILFSLNYALCFMVVKEFNGTIATKQPAMTASTIAKSVDENNDLKIDSIDKVIHLIKKIFRTQTASFAGNVLVAFPTAIALFLLLDLSGVSTYFISKKTDLLYYQTIPSMTNAYYASVAGIFLSISGFIAGYLNNLMNYKDVHNRIIYNPFLAKISSKKRRRKIATLIDKKLAPHSGNLILGFLLGSAFLVQKIFGVPFDIRHIAFSSSYMGLISVNNGFDWAILLQCFAGVALIGFFNFIVSFGLTSIITFKSRGLTLNQLWKIIVALLSNIFKSPLDFILFKNPKTNTI